VSRIKESEKFRAETFRMFGFILLTPFGINILNILTSNLLYPQIITWKLMLSSIIAIPGYLIVISSYNIIEGEESKYE